MKKMAWITGILICVMVLLAALGSVCGAIDRIATDENFYSGQSRAAVMEMLGVTDAPDVSRKTTEYIGMDSETQKVFAREIVAFMKGETDKQPDVLNEKEQRHMLDVRAITRAAGNMSKTYLTIAAALAMVIAWTGAKLKSRAKPLMIGSLSAVTILMLVVANLVNEIRTSSFAVAFTTMHETMFDNDLWLLDPATDILIRMMPQQLFEQALLNGANLALRMLIVTVVLLLAVVFVVSGMIRRQLAKGE